MRCSPSGVARHAEWEVVTEEGEKKVMGSESGIDQEEICLTYQSRPGPQQNRVA